MNFKERQQNFCTEVQKHFSATDKTRTYTAFGVSNSSKVVEGGVEIGVLNLDFVKNTADAFIIATVMRFPPEDEVYFAISIKKDREKFLARLAVMKHLGTLAKAGGSTKESGEPTQEADDSIEEDAGATKEDADAPEEEAEGSIETIKYSKRNNLVPVYLASDGLLWMRNSGFWDSVDPQTFNGELFGPGIKPDQIVVALYPPTASARRSLLAREFIGWLGTLAGKENIHELSIWKDAATLVPDMRRMPANIPIGEIEAAIGDLGGHYPHGEVRRFHAALNFLDHKHFVILSGLSGTGKTQLALKYARAVHGVTSNTVLDPLIFECPVRPDWTDPSGLTGYFDVLTNRYIVPTFLEAILVATAHRESPVFVILDEMNLARVEYYLSDVLSCMETRGALPLHSNSVPLEGTTGGSIRAALPLPPNLFIVGTINVDETTNPVSDKVLDRASVIDMSTVDVPGFHASLVGRFPELEDARAASEAKLTEIHNLMQKYGFGFGYRLIEEFLRYHAFDAAYLKNSPDDVTDQLLVQKVLVKLRGGERQRPLLAGLEKAFAGLPLAQAYIRRLLVDLDDFGSFQALR